MNLYSNPLYLEDVQYVGSLNLPWEKLHGKSLMLSGATGLIGSFLVDVIMEKNFSSDLQCTVYALTRNVDKAKERFSKYLGNNYLQFILCDVNKALNLDNLGTLDYVLHLASNTHPMQYATDPIGTITANIIGLQNMLNAAVQYNASRFVFASSNEIYGENRGDVDFFDEQYCGYINSNTLRAGYPESKRCGEALCQAFIVQKNLDVVIARLTRTYGPTMLMSDTKAISQFIKKAINKEDIVLKSSGNQYYSFLYVADSVSGLLTVMLNGKTGEAYNIAEENNDIKLKDLANKIADTCGCKVVYEIPNSIEASGYSTATKARLDGHKIMGLGWKPRLTIQTGVERTIQILKDSKKMTELQSKLVEMLSWLDSFLRKNNLKYFIDFGTLLGAARHKGFIPWDDDVDISMPRPDYEKLIALLKEPVDHYVVESLDNGNKDFLYTFAKFYDTNTTMSEQSRHVITRGVYIDIFPIDGIGNSKDEATRRYKKYIRMYNFLMTRTCSIRKGRSWYKNFAIRLSRILIPSFLVNERKLAVSIDKFLSSLSYDDSNYVLCDLLMYEKNLVKELTEVEFEGLKVLAPKNYEKCLSMYYGNWRALPPESERVPKHDFIDLDFNKSYLN